MQTNKNIQIVKLALILAVSIFGCGNNRQQGELLFNGNFEGRINGINISIEIKNNNGGIIGTYHSESEGYYSIKGNIRKNDTLDAIISRRDINSLNLKGYYQNGNMIVEIDEPDLNLILPFLGDTTGTDNKVTLYEK